MARVKKTVRFPREIRGNGPGAELARLQRGERGRACSDDDCPRAHFRVTVGKNVALGVFHNLGDGGAFADRYKGQKVIGEALDQDYGRTGRVAATFERTDGRWARKGRPYATGDRQQVLGSIRPGRRRSSAGSTRRPAPDPGHSRHAKMSPDQLTAPFGDGWTYRLLKVNCGRKKCSPCRGGNLSHGPYWYAERRGKRGTTTRYIGKVLMSVEQKADAAVERAARPHAPPARRERKGAWGAALR